MNPATILKVPEKLRRGRKRGDQQASIESGTWLIRYMAEILRLEDFSGSDILDMGCGVKFTQGFLSNAIPVKSYTGIDVYSDMIEFLQQNVHDERFQYVHMDTHNDKYNPTGQSLADYHSLPVGDRAFDVICLFSVFTHLAPHDAMAMLKLLRLHIKDTGKLVFTIFLNELSEKGIGLRDKLAQQMGEMTFPEPPAFIDLDPEHPLLWAMYSRTHAEELIATAGWRVEVSYEPVSEDIAHHFVCVPS